MAPRKSRSRKTAEKMASYKAAASKRQQVLSRTSPRTKKNLAKGSDLRQDSEQNENRDRTNNHVVDCDSSQGSKSKKNDPRDAFTASQALDGAEKAFDKNEVIPETPPREVLDQRRKRVFAPIDLDFRCNGDDELVHNDESRRPSKKRKMFLTPPREEGSHASHLPTENNNTTPRDSRPRSHGGRSLHLPDVESAMEPYESDNADIEMDFNDLIEPPVPSAQKSLFPRPRPTRKNNSRSPGLDGNARRSDRCEHMDKEYSSERFPVDAGSLDMMKVSSTALTRLFQNFSKDISAKMTDMHKVHMTEVHKVADSIQEFISSEVRSLHGLFGMLTSGLKGSKTVRTVGKTLLSDWERKLDDLTPHASLIFGRDLFSRILCFNMPLKAVEIYQKFGDTDVQKASLSVQTLLFSLQPGDKKYRYSDDIGKLHSDFKFSVIQNTFFNVCRDTFDLFKHSLSSREQECGHQDNRAIEISAGGVVPRCRIIRPTWLGMDKVTMDHINEARNFLETPNQSRKGKVRQTPTSDDISCHGALRVYRLLGSHFHEGRGNFRSTFFQGLGYLLVPWKDNVVDISQDTVIMKFCEGENDLSLSIEDIPHTEQCSFNADILTANSVDATNKELLRKLFSDWPEMILSVKHDVYVVSGNGTQRKHSGGEKRSLRRLINLIDVALDCCVEYCRVGSRELFLRTHRTALQCVMVFALFFKAICFKFMRLKEYKSSSSALGLPDPVEVKVHGICLKDVIPGVNTQKNLLKSRCTRLTWNEYKTLDHQPEEEKDGSDRCADNDQVFNTHYIEENAAEGVGVI